MSSPNQQHKPQERILTCDNSFGAEKKPAANLCSDLVTLVCKPSGSAAASGTSDSFNGTILWKRKFVISIEDEPENLAKKTKSTTEPVNDEGGSQEEPWS